MQLIEKIQELGHSYLIIKDEVLEENEYMINMLSSGEIDNLIVCQRALYNNESVLKYDVTNMKSISSEYKGINIKEQVISQLIEDMTLAIRNGCSFLLEEKYYLFDPDYIFIDMETNTIKMLYVPFTINNAAEVWMKNVYYPFADFLLAHVDHTDDKATNIAYNFYRMSKEEFFSLESFNAIFRKDLLTKSEDNEEKGFATDNIAVKEQDMNELIFPFEESEAETQIEYKKPIICLLAGLLLLGIYILLFMDNVYGVYIGILSILLIVTSISLFLKNVWIFILNKRTNNIAVPDEVSISEYWDGDEKTVFFDENQNIDLEKTIHRIVWDDDIGHKEKIINSFPVIIGKKYDSVDICIPNESVSRKHAKIFIKKNDLYIQDLGSTNGTYINGKRLRKNECVIIDETSEIKFGKVNISVV